MSGPRLTRQVSQTDSDINRKDSGGIAELSNMTDGKSVRLFLADGTPGGLLTAEIMNWTGHVMAAPRSDLKGLFKRPEVNRTGIYVLIGDDPDNLGGTLAYIGEGDDVRARVYGHSRPVEKGGKDFWNRVVVLTSKDTNLTKAHARFLESRFLSIAVKAKRSKLDNSTSPPLITLPEADVSDMEYFIAQAQIILPVLGINIFREVVTNSKLEESGPSLPSFSTTPVFELTIKKDGIHASAQEVDGEFTVLEGSTARLSWSGADDGYKSLKESVEESGCVVPSPDGKSVRFLQDRVFSSPSAAAAVVAGRSANGRVEWKVTGTNMSYGTWQDQGVAESAEAES
jgi:hypothetical protein